MKKLSKKAWKEYFEEHSNWSVQQAITEYGLRITQLENTDVYALEVYNVPPKYMQEMGLKPRWLPLRTFILHEDEQGNPYMEEMRKTDAVEMLWKAQEGLNA